MIQHKLIELKKRKELAEIRERIEKALTDTFTNNIIKTRLRIYRIHKEGSIKEKDD